MNRNKQGVHADGEMPCFLTDHTRWPGIPIPSGDHYSGALHARLMVQPSWLPDTAMPVFCDFHFLGSD